MNNTNNGLKRLLKRIRAFTPVNSTVRLLIRLQTNFYSKVFRFFSTHWPVSGFVKFYLPNGEKVKIYSHSDDYIASQVFWKGYKAYEGPSVEAFYYLSKKSSVIFDIGANTGYFTLVGAFSNPKSNVHSFEPVDRIYARLNLNIKINNLLNVKTVNSVAGNSDNPVKFYLPKGEDMVMAGSTKKEWAKLHDVYGADTRLFTTNTDAEKANEAREIEVPSITLDTYKKNNKVPKIDLIKMDCECHEIEVLNGMAGILKEDKPIILMEVVFDTEWLSGHSEMATYLEIERMMKANGYYFYLIVGEALIKVDKLEHNPNERNYLFSTHCSQKTYLPFSEIDSLHGSTSN